MARPDAIGILMGLVLFAPVAVAGPSPAPSVPITPTVNQPWVNLGGVTGKHASNWTAYLALGGRGIDTGLTYGDAVQEKVATAIAASGLPRSEIFLGTKVPCCPNKFGPWPGAHCTVAEFNGTIAQDVARNTALLGSAPDLTLLHWPCITLEQTLTAWRGLETALADGHTRAIGVSNFNASLLAKMLPKVNVTPAVNQCGHSIAHHTLNQTAATCKGGYCGGDDGTAAFCATHGIQYSAYTPLGGLSGLDIFKESTVIAIGKAHNVSAAQVALRWLVQKNITVVTAANNPEYIAQDIDLFSWGELTADEMAQLAALTPPAAAAIGALGEHPTLKTDDVDSGGDRVITCDPTVDSTAILTDALNNSHTSVTLATGLVCITEPLVVDGSTNLTLTLQQGAELQAKRGSQQFGVLLSLNGAAAVTIQGSTTPRADSVVADPYSPSASELARPTLRMWRQDYANSTLYSHDEHRHALSIHGCSQLTLRNLRLTQSGGDGVYVESVSGAVFSFLTLDQNLRQGMSVISANGLFVKDSVFSNTKGTAPMAGIDFEPNEPRNSLSGIEIRSCRVVRNAGAGVQFALHAFTEKSPSVDILFNQTLIVGPSSPCVKSDPDCFLTKGTSYYRWGILVEAWSSTLPTGSIRFINTTVVDTHGWSSPPVWIEKPATPTALTVEFSDLTVNMSSKGPAMTVSAVEPRSGGVSATGVVINRQCCAGGGPFLVAKGSGNNQLVDVAVRDVRVALSSSDTKSQAAVECSSSLASDAAHNGVTVTNVSCGVATLTLKSDDHDDAAIVESVRLDFSGHSRRFDGLGGVSAGGSSRLLRDYPPRLAGEILDYMFKPRFGAAYNVLKVEIGGDGQSTHGVEPSHMHDGFGSLNCSTERGYELWMLQQAKARNPELVTYGLSWTVPRWVGPPRDQVQPTGNFYTADNIAYQTAFVGCVAELGFELDLIGIWNERGVNLTYVKQLRDSLDAAGHQHTKIVIPDGNLHPDTVLALKTDPGLAPVVSAIVLHGPPPAAGSATCVNTTGLQELANSMPQLQLWNGELDVGHGNWTVGATCYGRALSQNFVRHNMTSSMTWPPIRAQYQSSGAADFYANPPAGVVVAVEPWSGHYQVGSQLWMTAHWTQAVDVGWRMLTPGQPGGSRLLPHGGSIVGTASIDSNDVTIIIENLNYTAGSGGACGSTTCVEPPACGGSTGVYRLTVQVAGQWTKPAPHMHVWRSNRLQQFIQQPDVVLTKSSEAAGTYEFTLEVLNDAIYTVTTRSNLFKGKHPPPPPSGRFTLPYEDNFTDSPPGSLPRFFADQGGSLEITPAGEAKQAVFQNPGPMSWQVNADPFSIIGDTHMNWTDVVASVEVRFEPTGTRSTKTLGDPPDENATTPYAIICTRTNGPWHPVYIGYCARLTRTGMLTLTFGSTGQPALSTPSRLDLDLSKPVRLSIASHGTAHRADASQAGHAVSVQATSGTLVAGMVGLGSGYHPISFDAFRIERTINAFDGDGDGTD